jgi:glutamyl-tRNA reductase
MKEAHRAEEIVDGEGAGILHSHAIADVVPTIVEMRANFEKLRHDEIDRYRKKLKDFTPEQLALLDQITESLTNKILHTPITIMKAMAHDPQGAGLIENARKLFGILPPDENDKPPL